MYYHYIEYPHQDVMLHQHTQQNLSLYADYSVFYELWICSGSQQTDMCLLSSSYSLLLASSPTGAATPWGMSSTLHSTSGQKFFWSTVMNQCFWRHYVIFSFYKFAGSLLAKESWTASKTSALAFGLATTESCRLENWMSRFRLFVTRSLGARPGPNF